MAAKNKEVEILSLNDLEIDVNNSLKYKNITQTNVKKSGEKFVDEGNGAEIIFNKLKELKVI